MSKIDTAISLLADFSSEFQQAVLETRHEMDSTANGNICTEDSTHFNEKSLLVEKDEKFLVKVDSLRRIADYENYKHLREFPVRIGPGVCTFAYISNKLRWN